MEPNNSHVTDGLCARLCGAVQCYCLCAYSYRLASLYRFLTGYLSEFLLCDCHAAGVCVLQVSAYNGIESQKSEAWSILPSLVKQCVRLQRPQDQYASANIIFKMNSTTDATNTVLVQLGQTELNESNLIGFQLHVWSEDTLEDQRFYLSYGKSPSNCRVSDKCIVQGLYRLKLQHY